MTALDRVARGWAQGENTMASSAPRRPVPYERLDDPQPIVVADPGKGTDRDFAAELVGDGGTQRHRLAPGGERRCVGCGCAQRPDLSMWR